MRRRSSLLLCLFSIACASASALQGSEADSTDGADGSENDEGDASSGEGAESGQVLCDVWEQDCPQGEKCLPPETPQDDPVCIGVVDNPRSVGDECFFDPEATLEACDLSSICVPTDPSMNLGLCLAICAGSSSAPECPEGTTCSSAQDPKIICEPDCNPLASDCDAPWICKPSAPTSWDFSCATPGAPGTTPGTAGDDCDGANPCGNGYLCVEAGDVPGCGSESCCTEYCDLSDAGFACAGADAGQSCEPYGTDPTPGLELLGLCVVP